MSHFLIQRVCKCVVVAWKPVFCITCKTLVLLLHRSSLSLLYTFLVYFCNCLKMSGLAKQQAAIILLGYLQKTVRTNVNRKHLRKVAR